MENNCKRIFGVNYHNLMAATIEYYGFDAKLRPYAYGFKPEFKGEPLAVIPAAKKEYGILRTVIALLLNRKQDTFFIVNPSVKRRLSELGINTTRLRIAFGDLSKYPAIRTFSFDEECMAF